MDHKVNAKAIKVFFTKYRFVTLVLLVGIGLMLIPETKKAETQVMQTDTHQSEVRTESEQLADILSQIQGAGRVQVMLSVKAGEEMLYQTDTQKDSSGGERTETLIVTDSSREESGLVRQVRSPLYLGAIVVCQGGDRAPVRLAITEAVSKITGLGADNIVVLKMK